MAITRNGFFNTNSQASAALDPTVWTAGVTGVQAGETLLVGIWWASATRSIASIGVDEGGETISLLGSKHGPNNPQNQNLQFAIINNVQSTGTKTIRVTLDGGLAAVNWGMVAWRLGGTLTSGAADGSPVGATGSDASPRVDISTTGANHALFGILTTNNQDPSSADSGFTLETVGDSQQWDSAVYDLDVNAAGSKTIGVSGNTANWTMLAVAIKDDASASVAPHAFMHMTRMMRR